MVDHPLSFPCGRVQPYAKNRPYVDFLSLFWISTPLYLMGDLQDSVETWPIDKLSELVAHPAAEIFPMLTGDALTAFTGDIEAHGVREPLVVFHGRLLDGRNRLAACHTLGMGAPVRQFEGDESDAIALVVSLNVQRRHLNQSQAAVAAALCLELFRAEANRRQREGGTRGGVKRGPNGQPKVKAILPEPSETAHDGADSTASAGGLSGGTACEDAARAFGTSETYVKHGKRIVDIAPDVAQLVLAGEVLMPAATKLAALNPKERKAALDSVRSGDARNVNTAVVRLQEKKRRDRTPKPETPGTIEHRDAVEFLESLDRESVDLLLTDPPYLTDVDDIEAFANAWTSAALPTLKTTGQAYICVGNYPEEIAAYLSAFRRFDHIQQRSLIYWRYKNTIGPRPSDGYRQNVQAVFYLRGHEAPPLNAVSLNELDSVIDINAPDGRLGERYHAWQKPDGLAELFVRHGSTEGDLVVDPFAGTGTFLTAAAKLGRRAIGSDNSEDSIRIALERGCERAA